MNREVNLKRIKIEDAFWSPRQELVLGTILPYQEKILNDAIEGVAKSHALENFRIAAGLKEGRFYGMVFQDSDVAKWLEAAAYALITKPDEELEKRVDDMIDIIGKAQQPDGYLNTYFTLKAPGHRWENLQECHELYCAGHMMEAAAAYYEATGKRKLLDIMERMAEHIGNEFGPGKRTGIPGHPEVEIGLMRLFDITGKVHYKELAQYFIDERGKNPDIFVEETKKRGWTHFKGMDPADTKYFQIDKPVREQETAEGHSVRAVYLYTAMADIAGKTGDQELLRACTRLWDNITRKRMYITGGIGSTVAGEAFTIDYDLPNDTMYAETCASIGMVFFAKKMLDIHPAAKYAEVMERELYNGVLSGMQMDGRQFFYVNPLEVNPGISGELHGHKHALPLRQGWYECACCPPNLVRLLMSIGKYAWSESADTLYSHLYLSGKAEFDRAVISVASGFPWYGEICYKVNPREENSQFTLALRIPSYAKDWKLSFNQKLLQGMELKDGYFYMKRQWKKGDEIELRFSMPVRRIYCNTQVRSNIGCVALQRGPLVYCLEEADNGEALQELAIPENAPFTTYRCEEGKLKDMVILEADGQRIQSRTELYPEEKPDMLPWRIKAIPYFAWGNRGLNQMRVWIREINFNFVKK